MFNFKIKYYLFNKYLILIIINKDIIKKNIVGLKFTKPNIISKIYVTLLLIITRILV